MSSSAGSGSLDELLEREAEKDAVCGLLDSAASGSGRTLVVEGPAGIGKTALLRWARATAQQRRMTVLTSRATELEQDFAYGVVRQLFEPSLVGAAPHRLERVLDGPAEFVRSLLLPEQGRAAHGTPNPQSAMAVLHGLYWLTANLSSDSELLMIVDDSHWVDLASARFLQYLVPRVESLPLALLLALRTGEAVLPPMIGMMAEENLESIRLKPLSASASRRVVEIAFGGAEEGFSDACHQAAGGNPFLIRELLRSARERGVQPVSNSREELAELVSEKLSANVQSRLNRLSPDATTLARAVAVAGKQIDPRLAAGVAGLGESRAAVLADSLGRIGILKTGRPLDFVHPIVRSSVYAQIPEAERSAGHATMARRLAAEGAPSEQVALHLLNSEPAGDGWAVERLRKAGHEALQAGVPESAVSYLRRALAEPPAGSLRARVLLELGVAEKRVEPAAALEHLRQAYDLTSGARDRALVCRELVGAYLATGKVGDAAEAVDSSIAALPAGDELALRLEAELVAALRQGQAASPLAEKSLERWRGRRHARTPAERLMLSQLAVYSALRGTNAEEVADLAEQALGGTRFLSENSPESLVAYVPVYPLLCADRFSAAELYLDRALLAARASGSPLALCIVSVFRSFLAYAVGDLREAEASASTATDLVFRFDWKFFFPGIVAHVSALIQMGELDSAEALIERAGLQAQVPDTVPGRILLATRGMLRVSQKRIEQGLTDLLGLLEREQSRGPSNLYLTPYRPWAALALSSAGERTKAVELIDREVGEAFRWGAPRILGMALRIAGLIHGGEEGLKMLRESVTVLEGSKAKLAYAESLTDLGAALRRAGARSEALAYLRTGMDLGYHCGARPLSERARSEMKLMGARPRARPVTGVDALTAGERRVADLARQGLTNRQIAQSLFLTARTVELHLTHSYQKLGITSRKELASAFAGEGH